MNTSFVKPTDSYYVKRAAEWLDNILPEWAKEITLNDFNILDDSCPLGQIGAKHGMNAWAFANFSGFIVESDVEVMLINHVNKTNLQSINKLWKEEIKKRRENA